jgi:hypothetical protein
VSNRFVTHVSSRAFVPEDTLEFTQRMGSILIIKEDIATAAGNSDRRREHRFKPHQDAMLKALPSKPSKARERGYILLTSAVSLTVLLGFLGLAVDVGYLQFQKRRIQSAADAAAAGAAFQLAAQARSPSE